MKKLILFPALFLLAGFSAAAETASSSSSSSISDWSGWYGGLIGSTAFGTTDWSADGEYHLNDEAYLGGVVCGYNWQTDYLVYGLEFSSQWGQLEEEDWPDYEFKDLFDIKGRMGRACGDWMPYVSLGYTWSHYEEDYLGLTMDGYNVGVGVDHKLTEQLVIGLEYSLRSLTGAGRYDQQKVDAELSTVSLRLLYRF